MIILTSTDADQVRGLTMKGHALAPRPMVDGNFALPETVLNDPAHQSKRAFLATLNIRLDSTIRAGTPSVPSTPDSPRPDLPLINSDWSQDAALNAACSYKQSWPVAKLVAVNSATDSVVIVD